MAGIGRLKDKITSKTKIEGGKPTPLSSAPQKQSSLNKEKPGTAAAVPLQSIPAGPPVKKPHLVKDKLYERILSGSQATAPSSALQKQSSRGEGKPGAPTDFIPNQPTTSAPSTKKPLSPKDKLYEQILSDSKKEKLGQQQFIARVQGKAETGTNVPSPLETKKEKVVFRPVPQKPSRSQKIIIRILIVLLIVSLGFLLYVIAKGYLI